MDKQSQEVKDSPEGLFFCPNISNITDLERAELSLWMGRGACFGWSDEQRETVQKDLKILRATLIGDVALG